MKTISFALFCAMAIASSGVPVTNEYVVVEHRGTNRTLTVELPGYVPSARKVNGQPLTSDITIVGMPSTGLVWNATARAVKTANGAKTIGADDVGAYAKTNFITFTNDNAIQSGVYAGKEKYGTTEDCAILSAGGDLGFPFNERGFYVVPPGLSVYANGSAARHFAASGIYSVGFRNGVVYDYFAWNYPRQSGTLAVEGWSSLRTMLADANTSTNADCECIRTNICNLIYSNIVNTVNSTKSRFYDAGLGVEWTFVPYDGEFMFIATTNVNREVIE